MSNIVFLLLQCFLQIFKSLLMWDILEIYFCNKMFFCKLGHWIDICDDPLIQRLLHYNSKVTTWNFNYLSNASLGQIDNSKTFLYPSRLPFKWYWQYSVVTFPCGGIPLPGRGIVGKNWSARSSTTVRNVIPKHQIETYIAVLIKKFLWLLGRAILLVKGHEPMLYGTTGLLVFSIILRT